MNSNDPDQLGQPDASSRTYAMSGKIMFAALIILFLVIVTMLFLHFYTSLYLQARRRHLRRSRNRRATTFVFFSNPSTTVTSRALDPNVLKSLPVFSFSGSTDNKDPTECSVCLSEFEANETCRVLPNCNHTFHVECIDMWFHSHSTCPLCRSNVERPVTEEEQVVMEIPPEPVYSIEPGSSSASSEIPTTKPADISEFQNALTRLDSSANQSCRSPMSRVLSFTRMLSRERRITPSPHTGAPPSSPMTESDVERGGEERR